MQLQLLPDESEWPDYCILLCLMPQYAKQLISNDKKFEYRRGQFIQQAATAFVYATTPKTSVDNKLPNRQLVAVAKLGMPIVGLEETIGVKEAEEPGSRQVMLEWLRGHGTASAHPVERVHVLEDPITCEDIRERFPSFQPPQRYIILNHKPELLAFLKSRISIFR